MPRPRHSGLLSVDRRLAPHGVEYEELAPGPGLSADVEAVWTMRARRPLAAPIVHPSAGKSSVDLIVSLDGNFCQRAEQHLFGASGRGAYLVGALSSPQPIVTAGRCAAIGVRFRPGRARAFFGVPMHELTDRVLSLGSISSALERRLAPAAQELVEHGTRLQALVGALLEVRSLRRPRQDDDAVAAAMRLIDEAGGNVSVAALAHAVGTGPRQLERRFRDTVGMTPKTVCRITRVQRAMAQLSPGRRANFADVAYRCGFYDQAHLIREFRAFAGVTPGAFAGGCDVSIAS